MEIDCAKKQGSSAWLAQQVDEGILFEGDNVKNLGGVGKVTVQKLEAASVTVLGQLKAMVGNEARLKETSNMIANKVGKKLTVPVLKQL
eukprot:8141469-Ditylum_brightwellii.AAC.1